MSTPSIDVAIIGAGPYGLSLASLLRARGVESRIFGVPMLTWRQMPPGMCLKSLGFATNIPSPQGTHTLPEYCRERGLEEWEPIEISTFVRYGEWFQKQMVHWVEQAEVTGLARDGDAFAVTLDTGERFRARRVVMATGLKHFERLPEALTSLPPGFVTHTGRVRDYSVFSGRDVTVLGAGQSALEAAAVLHEGGARVRLVARHDVLWGDYSPRRRPLLQRLRRPWTVLGTGWKPWVLQHLPGLMRHVPRGPRVRLTRRLLGPLGAWWLRERVEGKVPALKHTAVLEATAQGEKIRLRLGSAGGAESRVETDHVVCGTGYEYNLDRLPYLDPALAAEVRRIEGAPALTRKFESSIRGLYFIGPIAAYSFGPLLRFVAGATYATPLLARHLARGTE